MTDLESAPQWYRQALAVPHGDLTVEVAGATVHALTWGEPGRRGLVFVHGGGANAHWWTHLAAQFADEYRVVALDLSGHGDSDHREIYSLEQWTDEVMAVVRAAGVVGPPVLVGHSMGGFVAIVTAALFPNGLEGVIVVDSPVTEPDPEVASFHVKDAFGRERIYDSIDEAVARFRTVPAQEHYLPYVMDHLARMSLRPSGDGFAWKFDRGVFAQFAGGVRSVAYPYLPEVRCRLALLRCENGLVTEDIGHSMFEGLGRVTPVIELPEAGHHPMLDQPLILLTAIRALLADWEHSEPHRR